MGVFKVPSVAVAVGRSIRLLPSFPSSSPPPVLLPGSATFSVEKVMKFNLQARRGAAELRLRRKSRTNVLQSYSSGLSQGFEDDVMMNLSG